MLSPPRLATSVGMAVATTVCSMAARKIPRRSPTVTQLRRLRERGFLASKASATGASVTAASFMFATSYFISSPVLISLDSMKERFGIYGFAVAAFAASEILARVLGIRFASETLGTLYQYLDP